MKELKDGSPRYLDLQGWEASYTMAAQVFVNWNQSLRLSLAVLYWETAMFLSLVANASLSGVTCALYPL